MTKLIVKGVCAASFGFVAFVLAALVLKILEQILPRSMVKEISNSVLGQGLMAGLSVVVIFCFAVGWNWLDRTAPSELVDTTINPRRTRLWRYFLVLAAGVAVALIGVVSLGIDLEPQQSSDEPFVYDQITGAFGKELGSIAAPIGKDKNVYPAVFPFSPVSPSPYFSEYEIEVTPLSGRIAEILVTQSFEDKESCEGSHKDVEAILDIKYGGIKSASRDQIDAVVSYTEGRREIQLLCSFNPLFNDGYLQLKYIDWELTDLVLQEALASKILEERRKRDDALASGTDGF